MTVIVSGASRGLGRAIAEKFASGGYDLCLCSRDFASLSATRNELAGRYPAIQIKAAAFDLGRKEEAIRFGKWVLEQGLGVDVLVNNAGQFIPGRIADETDGSLEQMMQVNLYSAYHLTRTLLPGMQTRKKGHIFNICSVASLQAYPNGGAYSISKFALAGFSANLREEMKPQGIKVTAVYPGAVFTDSWAGSGVEPQRIMETADVAAMIFAAAGLSPQATVEEILLRPQLGDL